MVNKHIKRCSDVLATIKCKPKLKDVSHYAFIWKTKVKNNKVTTTNPCEDEKKLDH